MVSSWTASFREKQILLSSYRKRKWTLLLVFLPFRNMTVRKANRIVLKHIFIDWLFWKQYGRQSIESMSHGSAIFVYNPACTRASRAGSPSGRPGHWDHVSCDHSTHCLCWYKLLFNPRKAPCPLNYQWQWWQSWTNLAWVNCWYDSAWSGPELACYCLYKVFPDLAPHQPSPAGTLGSGDWVSNSPTTTCTILHRVYCTFYQHSS